MSDITLRFGPGALIGAPALLVAMSGCQELYVRAFEGWIANDEDVTHHYHVVVELLAAQQPSSPLVDESVVLKPRETHGLGEVGSADGTYRISATMDNATSQSRDLPATVTAEDRVANSVTVQNNHNVSLSTSLRVRFPWDTQAASWGSDFPCLVSR